MIVLAVVILLVAGAAIGIYLLTRDTLSQFDLPSGQLFTPKDDEARRASDKAIAALNARLRNVSGKHEKLPWKERILTLRETMDEFFAGVKTAGTFTPVDAGGVSAEWVTTPGTDSSRRFLYIHGGAFFAGSPKSHRVLTSKLSEITNSAVLAIDYRLTPENSRMDGVEDCRSSYDWMLRNGPQGGDNFAPTAVFVAGDSAGGNLALSLLHWIRDNQRPAPNAALAFSPTTDGRFTSPSIRTNLDSDVMLKPLAARFSWLPEFLFSLGGRFMSGRGASNPVMSPLLADLGDLPPILIQCSECEILRDDGRRYVNKAVAAGTDATLQVWDNVPHVWPIFYPDLPEAEQAFDEIEAFFKRHG